MEIGPDEITLAENRERVRIVLEHPIAQHGIRRAAKQGHRADGRDDGGHAADRHERAVDAAGHQSRAEPDRDEARGTRRRAPTPGPSRPKPAR